MNQRFKDIIRPLSESELGMLEQNILRDGIRDPLVVWGDTLIDGHNRYAIAQKHGLEYKTVQVELEDDTAAKIWIMNNQLGRRNLSTATRALMALDMKPLFAEQAKERQQSGLKQNTVVPREGTTERGKTRDQLAKIAKVSKSSIDYAEYIKAHAPDEIMQKVENDEMSLRTAYKETVKVVPPVIRKPGRPKIQTPVKDLTEKECTTCGLTRPIDKFYFSQGRYSSSCKQCEQMKKTYGISSTIRENIGGIQETVNYMTDTERVMEYSIEDVIVPIQEEVAKLIRVIDAETKNHSDLLENPGNKAALLQALEAGVNQIQNKIQDLAR